MNNHKITIDKSGEIVIPDVVYMTIPEIARLFGVYTQTVNVHVKAILKSGAVSVDFSKTISIEKNLIVPEFFGIDMLIALAFRIQSEQAKIFQQWIICKIRMRKTASTLTYIKLPVATRPN